MFINQTADGRNNRCGDRVAQLRTKAGLSQKQLADRLQVMGLDIDKNAIQRIEAGKRFVTDIELVYFAQLFQVSCDELLGDQ